MSLSCIILDDITSFRQPYSLHANPLKVMVAEVGYITVIPFAVVEAALSAIAKTFSVCLPIGQNNHDKMTIWLKTSTFSIVWAIENSAINFFCNDIIPIQSIRSELPPDWQLVLQKIQKVSSVASTSVYKNERIKSMIYGQCVCDGLGLITEFKQKREASKIVGNELNFDHQDFNHTWLGNSSYPRGSFTDDSEQAVSIVRAVDQFYLRERKNLANPRKRLECYFAEQMLNWSKNGLNRYCGYKSVKNPKCYDIGNTTRASLTQPDFAQDPIMAAERAWKQSSASSASNGSVMRTSVVGAIYSKNLEEVVQKTILFAKTTHSDPCSIASAVALTVAIAIYIEKDDCDVNQVTRHAIDISKAVLRYEMTLKKEVYGENLDSTYRSYARSLERYICGNYNFLSLDQNPLGFAYKCVGSAFEALRSFIKKGGQRNSADSIAFRSTIQELVAEGGDADTNAAVAGALIGAYSGNGCIPKEWLTEGTGLNKQAQDVIKETSEIILNLNYRM